MRDTLIRQELLAHVEVAMKAGGSPVEVADMIATAMGITWCRHTEEFRGEMLVCDRPKGHHYGHKTASRIRF